MPRNRLPQTMPLPATGSALPVSGAGVCLSSSAACIGGGRSLEEHGKGRTRAAADVKGAQGAETQVDGASSSAQQTPAATMFSRPEQRGVGSMRVCRARDLLAEELPNSEYIGRGQRERDPSDALVAQPDAEASRD